MDTLQEDIKKTIGERKSNDKWALLIFIGLMAILFLFGPIVKRSVKGDSKSKPKDVESTSIWLPAGGNLWTGVELCYGEGQDKLYVGKILGGNENYIDPYTGRKFRAIKILTKSGSAEWKDRNAVIFGSWYIRRNDPALDRMEWYEYQF